MKRKGYAGSQLRLHLDKRTATIEELSWEAIDNYLGGKGYAVKLIYDEQKTCLDRLKAESKFVCSTGPLTLNMIPGGGSVALCFKSPLSNTWCESRAGSDFGPDMRKAGYDHIIVEGQASEPVYVVIQDERVEFRNASHLVGKTVSEKRSMIENDLPAGRFSVACIGPAGENLVRFANVMFQDRAAGRGGAGAVLGAKNMLGIAVSGSKRIDEADSPQLREVLREAFQTIKSNPVSIGFKQNGTIGDIPGNDDSGDWPTKNWQSNSWAQSFSIVTTSTITLSRMRATGDVLSHAGGKSTWERVAIRRLSTGAQNTNRFHASLPLFLTKTWMLPCIVRTYAMNSD